MAVGAPIAATREVCFLVDICEKSIDLFSWLFPYSSILKNFADNNRAAFRDRDAGRQNNLSKDTAEGAAPRGGYRGGRGGGGGGGRREYDRHSATGRTYVAK